jgi:hypothetical protein
VRRRSEEANERRQKLLRRLADEWAVAERLRQSVTCTASPKCQGNSARDKRIDGLASLRAPGGGHVNA